MSGQVSRDCAKSKGTRKRAPKRPRVFAEARLVVALTVQKLATECFSRRHVRVHLDPRAANRLELSRLDSSFDLVEQQRVVLFNPERAPEGLSQHGVRCTTRNDAALTSKTAEPEKRRSDAQSSGPSSQAESTTTCRRQHASLALRYLTMIPTCIQTDLALFCLVAEKGHNHLYSHDSC